MCVCVCAPGCSVLVCPVHCGELHKHTDSPLSRTVAVGLFPNICRFFRSNCFWCLSTDSAKNERVKKAIYSSIHSSIQIIRSPLLWRQCSIAPKACNSGMIKSAFGTVRLINQRAGRKEKNVFCTFEQTVKKIKMKFP